MRIQKTVTLPLVLALTLTVAVTVLAADQSTRVDVYDNQQNLVKSVVFVIGRNEYFVNGHTPGIEMDARPFIEQGRTFVPVRYLGYALGLREKDIKWDGEFNRATLARGDNSIQMTIGARIINVNGKPKVIDVAPILKENEWRTYLPARYVAEGLGYVVEWKPPDIVLAYPEGAERPDISTVEQYIGQDISVREQGQRIWDQAKPFEAELRLPEKYTGPYGRQLPDEPVMEVTLEELREKGVQMDGIAVILDLWVDEKENKLYVKQARLTDNPRPMPVKIVEEGNLVRLELSIAPKPHDQNPFVYDYDGKYTTGNDENGAPYPESFDLTKAQGFLFWGSEENLYVPNPA